VGRCGLIALAAVVMLVGCGHPAPGPSGAPPADRDAMGQLGPVPSATPGAACLTAPERASVVRFRSDNGAQLAGVRLGTGRVGVIFAHSGITDLCDWVPYARVLAGEGYTALSLDLNGFGASQASAGVPVDPRYDEDFSATVRLLRGSGVPVVFLMGEVIGGTAAVKAASQITPPVAGVIDVSSPADAQRMDGVAAARRLTVPLLCIASAGDEFLDGTRQIADAATGAPEHELLVVPSSDSETMLFDTSLEPRAGEVRARVEVFLRRYAGPDAPAAP
jgi:pimeloyl-ACP methyl ester carboxylesterase